MNQPVVIVGAGPTGLMLAAELGLAEVPVVFLERRDQPTTWSQAFAIHMSSVEMLQQRGLADFDDAPRFTNYNFGFPGITAMDERKLPLIVSQRRVERLLEKRVREIGVEIRRCQEFLGFEQDDDGVTVAVRGDAGDYAVRGSYLVGCDGGRSTVRKAAGIGFPGTESTLCGRTGDMEITNDEDFDAHGSRFFPTGLAAIIKHPDEPGLCRATVIEFATRRMSDDIPIDAEEFRAAFHRVTGVDLKIGKTPWLTRFGDSTRHADRYRAGRVFIGGDAAHIHFPSAGQGLNTGMQDAMNLGWKLAAAWHGWGSERLLDSYHDERHPIGHEICVYPQAQVALMYPPDRVGPLRELIGELARFEDVSRYLVDRSTGLGVCYEMPGAASHPLLGRRIVDAPLTTTDGETSVARTLHAGRGVVLDLTGGTDVEAALAGWSDRVDVVSAQPSAELDAATVLIRPDGHVAFVDPDGGNLDGLRSAAATWFGVPARLVPAA
jgi:2-polyprenyl-6-methoxyphenol hydroxylase-like FAD-dependent oxidoreductase